MEYEEKRLYVPSYNPLSITFICTGELREKRILDLWNNSIVDSTTGFDVTYYDTYAKKCTLRVTTLKPNGVDEEFITYREVYPKSVQSIQLNHSTQNTVLRVNAEIQYAFFETVDINLNPSQENLNSQGRNDI